MTKLKTSTKVAAPEKSVPPAPGEATVGKTLKQMAALLLLLHIIDTLADTPSQVFQTIIDIPDDGGIRGPALRSSKEQARIILEARNRLKELGERREKERSAANA